jgi:hypothetical protein
MGFLSNLLCEHILMRRHMEWSSSRLNLDHQPVLAIGEQNPCIPDPTTLQSTILQVRRVKKKVMKVVK